MKIEVRERPRKMILYWMSKDESQNTDLMLSLRSEFKMWKTHNYQPVVFVSGEGNMQDSMYLLMKRNRLNMIRSACDNVAPPPSSKEL